MKRCERCRGADLRDVEETVVVRVPAAAGGLEILVSGVSAAKCAACGVSYLSGPDLERADLVAAAEAMRRGVREGPALRFARKALGLRATELADLLDVSAETVSRWENGHRLAERSVWNTLAGLVGDALEGSTATCDRLRAFAGSQTPRRPIRLRLGPSRAE